MASNTLEHDAGADSEPILETQGLTKTFGGLSAVDRIDYRLQENELRCLIGPNGAGKSTFFNLLTGRLQPDEGTIRFKGDDITDLEPFERIRRGISVKFQDVSIYPSLTVRENLRIPVQRKEPQDLHERMERLLKMVSLGDKRDDKAENLSHGEQQWLELAMVISIDPDLMLLDEPTAGMTIEETKETGELIRSFVDKGHSVIVVEHDINFVRQIGQQVTVLNNGEVFAEGHIDEIEANEDVQRIYLGQDR